MVYEVHSMIIIPGSRVSDFAGQQGTDKASKHNSTYSIIHEDQQ